VDAWTVRAHVTDGLTLRTHGTNRVVTDKWATAFPRTVGDPQSGTRRCLAGAGLVSAHYFFFFETCTLLSLNRAGGVRLFIFRYAFGQYW
jgi:hypothetical protein